MLILIFSLTNVLNTLFAQIFIEKLVNIYLIIKELRRCSAKDGVLEMLLGAKNPTRTFVQISPVSYLECAEGKNLFLALKNFPQLDLFVVCFEVVEEMFLV